MGLSIPSILISPKAFVIFFFGQVQMPLHRVADSYKSLFWGKKCVQMPHRGNEVCNIHVQWLCNLLIQHLLKVARYSFSRPIPPKFEHKLRGHKQSFGKIAAAVVLDKDENLL